MNGFEPLRRRVIDYTAAGQWQEVYVGPIEESEEYRLKAENAKLREQMEWLVTLLRNDCDIDASWDGLRGFWTIGLTEGGCLMRDRACKTETENAKLRELAGMMLSRFMDSLPDSTEKPCDLCDMWDTCNYVNDRQCRLLDSMRELGVEVDYG